MRQEHNREWLCYDREWLCYDRCDWFLCNEAKRRYVSQLYRVSAVWYSCRADRR